MQPASSEGIAPTRRRHRLSSSSPAAASKRAKFGDAPAMTSARAKGKLPETIIDLASPAAAPQTRSSSAFQPQSGAKKLVIKNLRSSSREADIEEYYAQITRELDAALGAIFVGSRPSVPLEKLYRGVEDICRKGNAESMYCMLTSRIEAHLHNVVLPRIKRSAGPVNVDILRSLLAEWKVLSAQAMFIRSIFSFLDRTYLLRQLLPSINDMIIAHFRKMMFLPPDAAPSGRGETIGAKAVSGVYDLFEYDRCADDRMDADLLKESIRMLYVLGIYVKYFEPQFLRQSNAYFENFAASRSASSLKEYIAACKTLLQNEDYRCIAYNLENTTEKQLMDAAHVVLIDRYSEKLLHGQNLAHLLSEKDVKSMKGLYELLRLSGIQKKMKAPWGDYIRTTGASIISDTERVDEMVPRLLELRRSLDLMIRHAFDDDDDFLWGMREAFGKFMNDRLTAACWESGTSKIGEMTAGHIDLLLRGGLKALSKDLVSDAAENELPVPASSADEDAELDRQLDQALELFRFIEGKDTFEAFYKKDLARRLLMGRSASQDAERMMLTKLRGECGSNFTHNLEQMFKDQELAKDEMDAYRQWCKANEQEKPAVQLSVMILSAAAWPTYPDTRMGLPDEVAAQVDQFDRHYRTKHTGRILTWKHSLAHCSLVATFPKGSKELLVSAFQAVVLVLFNAVPDGGFLSYAQIATATGLNGSELDRTLQSLACGKVRVLAKHPKGRDVRVTDTFTFNEGFTDAKYRVKINQIQLKESRADNKAVNERVAQDRRFETQAAIVRIMKSRKSMGHAELVAEVINLTKKRGSVEPAAIKKEIESLMEKDYIEREGNVYTYLT
ncbi:ubiquitin ligase subunit CulD [Drechmeria coniospora]|uniref:Ubiquitin ligase subunit CulD n=1 Tax=Drechmeria coniospora TaxID=98403 RepID=A0A151GWG6_DRECN|nr:ubiquitin ligase subunit CulD [Drechmeria coniospora]KYK61411.1 ubiquitin ligase subunit CulD [Drechmeria coniospora]